MNTPQKLLLILVGHFFFGNAAWATPITVPVGQANRVHGPLFLPVETGITSLNGQTLSLDFVFSNDLFVRLFSSTTRNFEVSAQLTLHGEGTFDRTVGSGYTFGADGLADSATYTFPPGIAGSTNGIETFNYSLGFVFPLVDPATGLRNDVTYPFDIYGMHLDITLPRNNNFEVVGARFVLFPASNQPSEQVYAIGAHVPDDGGTLPLLAIGFLAVLRRCRKAV